MSGVFPLGDDDGLVAIFVLAGHVTGVTVGSSMEFTFISTKIGAVLAKLGVFQHHQHFMRWRRNVGETCSRCKPIVLVDALDGVLVLDVVARTSRSKCWFMLVIGLIQKDAWRILGSLLVRRDLLILRGVEVLWHLVILGERLRHSMRPHARQGLCGTLRPRHSQWMQGQ